MITLRTGNTVPLADLVALLQLLYVLPKQGVPQDQIEWGFEAWQAANRDFPIPKSLTETT